MRIGAYVGVIALFLVGCVGEDLAQTTERAPSKESTGAQKEEPAGDPTENPPTNSDPGANTPPATAAASGDTWKGAWHSTFNGTPMTGSMTLSMKDGASSKVTGTAAFGSSPCVPSATIDATRTGSKISGKLLASGIALDFTTTIAADGKSLTGVFSGQAGGCGNMSGSYDATLE